MVALPTNGERDINRKWACRLKREAKVCLKHRFLSREECEADIRERKLKFGVVPYVCRKCSLGAGAVVWHQTKDKRTVERYQKMWAGVERG